MPTVVVPRWVFGKDYTAMAIYPATTSDGITYTFGTSAPLTGILENIESNFDPRQLEVSAMDMAQEDYHNVKENNSISLTEIVPIGGSTLDAWQLANDLGKFVMTRYGKTFTFIGRRGRAGERASQDATRFSLTLTMVAIGTANPVEA